MIKHKSMNEKKETVCAVVVAYNRKNLLLECLEGLRKQTRPVNAIYLIDNASTDGTPEFLLEKGYIKELPPANIKEPWEKEFEIQRSTDEERIRLYYVRMHENIGGAGGFYEGVKRGYEKGYDWLWLMDDDAEPKEDALEKLSLYFTDNNVIGLASSVLLPNGNIVIKHRGKLNLKNMFPVLHIPLKLEEYQKQVTEIDIASFVGLLIKKEAIKKIGFPKKEFFIYHDDVEYCIRLRTVGKILLVPESVLIHKETAQARGEELVEKSFLNRRSKRRKFNRFWLSYYDMRNLVWLGKQYSENKLLFYVRVIKTMGRTIAGIILLDDYKYKRIKLVLSAYLDGLKGKFDNNKSKRILYGK